MNSNIQRLDRTAANTAQRRYREKIKDSGGIQFAGELKDPAHVIKLDQIKEKYNLRSRKAAIEHIVTKSLDNFKATG